MSKVDLSEGIDVVQLGGNIGAEIHGLDLRKSISNDQFKVLQDALSKGNKSFATTHYLLLQQDPEYRKQIEETE